MSSVQGELIGGVEAASLREAILRYQPASNWVSVALDPTRRMTIGFGFDLGRPEASEMLSRVGADPAAVRNGRAPISDAQAHQLFDIALDAAVGLAQRRVPGFAEWPPAQQAALLELIVWLGPQGMEGVFGELEELSLPITHEPLKSSPWFDARPAASVPIPRRTAPAQWAPNCWPRGPRGQTTFESFGLVAQLVSDNLDLLHRAEAMLPPGWRPVDAEPSARFGVWTDGSITVNGVGMGWGAERGASLLRLGAVVRHHVAIEAPEFTFVHAGVVEAGGCGIVIPGRSYTGKSTLVAELVRLGATYVSDEYAVLDPHGLVQPFAKPLSIRTGRDDPLGQLVPVPPALVAKRPVRAGVIVLTSYAPGGRWRPSVRSRAEGAFALLQNTVSARLRPGSALRATSHLARGAVCLVGQRGEAPEAARTLLDTALLQTGGSTTFAP